MKALETKYSRGIGQIEIEKTKLELKVDTNRNVNGDTKYDFDKRAFNCVETKREEQSYQPFKLI